MPIATPIKNYHQSVDQLDEAIVKLSNKLNAAQYDLLLLIREFDERAGWLKWGSTSCATWLEWRCDLSASAAREKVRVAHALKDLPLISAAFSTGALSYSKARALTRVATVVDEADLLEMALSMTAAHVHEHCRQRRNASAESSGDAKRAQAARSYRSWRDDSRGVMTITLELPMEEGDVFERALDKAAKDLDVSTEAPDESLSWHSIQADAAVLLGKHYLSGSSSGSSSAADHYQVMIHVDQEALTSGGGKSELPVETVKRLCCDGTVMGIVEDENGEPLNVGRKHRTVPTSIRRALWARDKGCVFPGCSHTRFVDAHHVKHWADGGETSIANTVLLCSSHHKLVHEGGYSIKSDYSGQRYFTRADGRAIPACGYKVADITDVGKDSIGELEYPVMVKNDSAESFADRDSDKTPVRELQGLYLV